MDYKKAYEEALERAMAGKPMDEVFPELTESKDERIRKVLIDMVKRETGFTGFPSQGQVLAFLEKKKEKQPEHLELKAGHWYICHRAFCCRADHLTVKEGERFMCEKDGIVKGFVIKEPEKYFMECNAPAPMEEEQQPAEREELPAGMDEAAKEYNRNNIPFDQCDSRDIVCAFKAGAEWMAAQYSR